LIERIIENWLTNSTERVFQIPFAQVLGLRGHRIKYISKHGVAEHGKDIVSVDPQGTLCAYQLKTGDLNVAKWGRIKREVDDLVELPIQYPSNETDKQHEPWLVTNGSISDDVRLRIQAMNQGNARRGHPALSIMTVKELLQEFVDAHGSFLPMEPIDIRSLLELYMANGRGNLPEQDFAAFVMNLLPTNSTGKMAQLRTITNALLLSKYAMFPYDRTENHVSVIKAWVIFLSHLYRYAEVTGCDPGVWESSELIVLAAIQSELDLLRSEVIARKGVFFEGSTLGDGGLMYQMRLTIVLGLLAVSLLRPVYEGLTQNIPKQETKLFMEQLKHLGFWGEAVVPYVMAIALLFEAAGDEDTSLTLVRDMLIAVAKTNNAKNRIGIPSPYFLPDSLLSSFYGIPNHEIELGQFSGNSYTLRTLVDFLVRKDRRDLLEPIWRGVTHVWRCEFYPADNADFFLWRCEEGEDRHEAFAVPTSWRNLSRELPNTDRLPRILHDRPWFALLMSLTYPHRLRSDLLPLLMIRQGPPLH
jgi:hypothetical protein